MSILLTADKINPYELTHCQADCPRWTDDSSTPNGVACTHCGGYDFYDHSYGMTADGEEYEIAGVDVLTKCDCMWADHDGVYYPWSEEEECKKCKGTGEYLHTFLVK